MYMYSSRLHSWHFVGSGAGTIFSLGGKAGPERGAEARSAEAPRGGVWGNFSKINVKMAYFSAFLQAEMVSSAVASRQD